LLTDPMTELPVVPAPQIPVTDRFHGVEVSEDYRWLVRLPVRPDWPGLPLRRAGLTGQRARRYS
jgi:hypothetical protein